jgi:hypothetical protein
MRTPLPTREKPRPLPEPLAATATTDAHDPAIDAVDELAAGGQAAAEAGDVGGGVGGGGSGVEDVGEGTRGWCRDCQLAVCFARTSDRFNGTARNDHIPGAAFPRTVRLLQQARRYVGHSA